MTIPTPGGRAIGVFDSGVGGLTVLGALQRRMPHRDFIYVGDTARVPYGRKPPEMVRAFAREIVGFLCGLGVDGIVIACNTASAVALPELAEECAVPVWGVIDPGVEAATRAARSGHVGVIGTKGTIGSGAYQRRLERRGFQVWARACPLLAPAVEEGLAESPEAELLVRHYLAGRPAIDTLILGCTHYPMLRNAIEQTLGPEVTVVDSAEITADVVGGTFAPPPRCFRPGAAEYYVSGDPAAFVHTAAGIAAVQDVRRLPMAA